MTDFTPITLADPTRPWMAYVHATDGRIWATNGAVLVSTPGTAPAAPEQPSDAMLHLIHQYLAAQGQSIGHIDAAALVAACDAATGTCQHCNGTASIACRTCHGNAYHTCSCGDDHMCNACNGTGREECDCRGRPVVTCMIGAADFTLDPLKLGAAARLLVGVVDVRRVPDNYAVLFVDAQDTRVYIMHRGAEERKVVALEVQA